MNGAPDDSDTFGGEKLPDMDFSGMTLEPDAGLREQLAQAASFGPSPSGAPAAASFYGGPPTKAVEPRSYADLCTIAHERFDPKSIAWKVRVNRTAPKDGRVAGNLGSFGDMSNEDFAQMFGGQKYQLTLVTLEQGIMGAWSEKLTSYTCDHVVPGAPKTLTVNDPHAPAPGQAGYAYPPQQQPTRLDELRYTNEASLTNKLLERTLNQQGAGSDAITKLTQHALAQQAAISQGTIETLRDQLRYKTEEVERIERRLREVETEIRTQRMEHEGERTRLIKEASDESERRAEARWSGELKQVQLELKTEREAMMRQLTAERELMDKKVSMIEDRSRQDLDRARNDAERQLEREKTDRAREVLTLTTINDTRINSLDRDNKRDIDSTHRMGEMVVSTKDAQINKLESENARLTSDIEALKKQVYKPFAQQVDEIERMADILGFEKPGDGDDDEPVPALPAAPGPKSLAEQMAAALPSILATAGPALGPLLARFAGPAAAPPPQALPPGPPVRQMAPPRPHVAPPRHSSVVGGPPPVNVPSAISQPQPQRQPAPAPPPAPGMPPAQPVLEPIHAPAHFQARGPQPETPGAIEALLTDLTAGAKAYFAQNAAPAELANLVRTAAPARVAAYYAWADSDNALVLLERIEPSFWSRGDVREWFDEVWTLIGEGTDVVVAADEEPEQEEAPAPAPPAPPPNVSPPAPAAQATASSPALPPPMEIIPIPDS